MYLKRFFLAVWLLIASFASAATVTLAWQASPSSSVVGYRLRAVDANGNIARSLDVGSALTGSVANLAGGERYWFNVVAYNAAGESAASNTVEWTAPSQFLMRINCGGGGYNDTLGQAWLADTKFVGGTAKTYTQTVSGTNDPMLYRSERYARALIYEIPVANGDYRVTLHLAEMYWTTSKQRVFSVSLEGQTVLANLDIYALAGRSVAIQRSFVISVTDGVLNIVGTATVDTAKLSAIEITR